MHLVRADAADAPLPLPAPPAAPSASGAGGHEERRLVALIRAGDAAAFETVFRLYAAPLATFARHYLRSPEAAADAVQDVFLAVWQGRSTLAVRGTLQGYLYGAVRNRAFDVLKHAGVHARWEERAACDGALDADGAEPPSPLPDALDGATAADLAGALAAALAALPERGRLVVLLRWKEEMSYAQIGALLAISPRTVEVHLRRGLHALRTRLAAHLPSARTVR